MSYIKLSGSSEYLVFTALNRSSDATWLLDILAKNKEPDAVLCHLVGSGSFNDYIDWKRTALLDLIIIQIDGSSYQLEWPVTSTQSTFHRIILNHDGINLSGTFDGVADSAGGVSAPGLVIKDLDRFGRVAGQYSQMDLEYCRYYNANTAGTLIHDWDANASNRVAGGQPVLTDAASGNDATGVNFPTDGSAWSDLSSSGITADVAWSSPAPQFSGSATTTQPSGVTATVAFTEPAAQFSGTATVAAATSTVTSDVITRNMGIGTGLSVAASEALDYVRLYNQSTGELVHEETGLSTNASGVFSFTAPIAAGDYDITWKLTSDGAKRMPTVTAS